MTSPATRLRQALLAWLQPKIENRAGLLVGAAAKSEAMKELLIDGGASHVESIEFGKQITETDIRFALYEEILRDPPDWLRAKIMKTDPEGTGFIYGGSFTQVSKLLGRPVLGCRSAAAFEAERKDHQHIYLGTERRCVRVQDLTQKIRDQRQSVVVQGVPRARLALSGSHSYLVSPTLQDDALTTVCADLAKDCEVAVLTALDLGLPTTFYGYIGRDWTCDFGPFEALVYSDPRTGKICALGILRPAQLDKPTVENCRTTLEAVVENLRRHTGYVGGFCTDGVVTDDGRYVIHEVNPRVCAGFGLLDELCSESIPLAGVDLALREGQEGAAVAVEDPLRELAREIQARTTPQVRLWGRGPDAGIEVETAAGGNLVDWVKATRTRVAGDTLVHLTGLA